MRAKAKGFGTLFYSIFILLFLILFPLPLSSQTADSTPEESNTKTSSQTVTEETKETEDTDNTEMIDTLTTEEGEVELDEPVVSFPMVETSIFTGAATYRIPIEVPPGRGGIVPTLSLMYNSYARNGLIGVGWTLDGVGSIQRSTRWGLKYNGTDFVELTGSSSAELVQRSDWGSNYYGRKKEGAFSKYQLVDPPNGPWIVTAKNGAKYYYGSTDDSKQFYYKGTEKRIFKWCLDRVEDTNGNYMTITYWKDQGEIYFNQIEYTGNVGLAPTHHIAFNYETREDTITSYTTQTAVKTAYRLAFIDISVDGRTPFQVRRYEQYYYMGGITRRSRLGEVRIPGTPFSPRTFLAYQDRFSGFGGDAVAGNRSYSYNTNSKGFRMADLNGDGRDDFVYHSSTDSIRVLLADESGNFSPDDDTADWGSRDYPYSTNANGFQLADVDGDNFPDFVYEGVRDGKNEIRVLLNFYDTELGRRRFKEDDDTALKAKRDHDLATNSKSFQMADMNGDGKADVVYTCGQLHAHVILAKSDGTGFLEDDDSAIWGVRSFGFNTNAKGFRLADVNGDGLLDFIYEAFQEPGYFLRVLLNTGAPGHLSGFTPDDSNANWGHREHSYSPNVLGFQMADVNADGLADVIYTCESKHVHVLLSTGYKGTDDSVGFLPDDSTARWGNRLRSVNSNGGFHMADVNGDGLADFIYDAVYNSKYYSYVMLSKGYGFQTDTDWGERKKAYYDISKSFRMVDSDGDGLNDFIYDSDTTSREIHILKSTSAVWSYYGKIPDMLIEVTNPFGGITSIRYRPSSEYTNTYLPFTLETVSTITIDGDNPNYGPSSTTTYDYQNGYYEKGSWQEKRGREFRGFGYAKSTDSGWTTKESWFLQDDIYKGLPSDQVIKDSSGNLYAQTTNTYNSTTPYSGVDFPYLERKDEYLCDGQPACMQTQTNFAFDVYGNLTQKRLEGDVTIAGDERYENTDYNPCNLTNWIVGRPSRSWITDKDGVTKAQSWFEYDNGTCDKGNLTRREDWLQGGTNPVTGYDYDNYGNRTSVTDPRGNTTITEYDAATRTFPLRTTIPHLGFYTEKTYDPGFGKALSETDYNSNVTQYSYDSLGRILTVAQPPDTPSFPTKQYSYMFSGLPRSQYVEIVNGGAGGYRERRYFDGLGRTYLTTRGATAILQETMYNARGLVDRKSMPYLWESPPQDIKWINYEYDALGRITKVTPPDGKYSTASYNGGITALVDANKHMKVQEKDGLGRLIAVEEYQGIGTPDSPYTLYSMTTYDYDPLNNLGKVADNAGNQTTVQYDTLSRKVKMTDPDTCTSQDPNLCWWSYEYDANGNLTAQVDAKQQRIEFSYYNPTISRDDPLNRVMTKHYPTGPDIVYSYDQGLAADDPKGRLTSVVDASGATQHFYDERGRTKKTIKTVDGVNYPIEMAYDSLNRMTSVKYPDNEVVSYVYDTVGNLSWVVGEVNYVTYTNYTPLGQPGNVTYGNQAITAYGYDPFNYRLTSILTSRSGQTVQNLSYLYDDAGNVTMITDNLVITRTQTFQYDHLNRLTQADSEVYPTTPITYQYNEIGNMMRNSQVGTYQYSGLHPHGVTQAGANAYTYDANGNMETGAGRVITYNYDNMPSSTTKSGITASFVYGYKGKRVKKTVGSSSTVYIGNLYECTDGVCTKYIFTGGRRIASKTGSNTLYYHTDHLGSSNVITDSSGNVVEEIYYFPYGSTRLDTGGPDVKHKYTGQEEDPETDLYYYGARYYDPAVARFITPDPIVPNFSDPQSLNRYSYGRNNPIQYNDPTGYTYTDYLLAGESSSNMTYTEWCLAGGSLTGYTYVGYSNSGYMYVPNSSYSYSTPTYSYSYSYDAYAYSPPSGNVPTYSIGNLPTYSMGTQGNYGQAPAYGPSSSDLYSPSYTGHCQYLSAGPTFGMGAGALRCDVGTFCRSDNTREFGQIVVGLGGVTVSPVLPFGLTYFDVALQRIPYSPYPTLADLEGDAYLFSLSFAIGPIGYAFTALTVGLGSAVLPGSQWGVDLSMDAFTGYSRVEYSETESCYGGEI